MIKTKSIILPKEFDHIGGHELGHRGNQTHIYTICPICKKGHWVRLDKGKPRNVKCKACVAKENVYFNVSGKDNPRWNGGKYKNDKGYLLVFIDEKSPYLSMRKKDNHVYEHRLIMAKHLGRPLERWEIVHHINHIKDDNRIENLKLLEKNTHDTITILEEENKRLKNKIKILEGWVND